MRLGLAMILLAACGPPTIVDCAVQCGGGDTCPPGFSCRNSWCAADPAEVNACESTPDASPADARTGTGDAPGGGGDGAPGDGGSGGGDGGLTGPDGGSLLQDAITDSPVLVSPDARCTDG